VATKIPKGLVAVAYATDDFWDIHRTRRLAVLADVLSDRLRIGIRDEKGASYSPFAFSRASRAYTGYGFLQTYIQVAPESTAMIVQAVKGIVADMAAQGITDEELRRAVDPILTGLKDLRRSNGYWLNSVMACSSRHPQQLEWSRTILDDYTAVTSADLMALVHTYLKNDQAAVMTFFPAADQH
jgi:zinc protease